MIIANKTNNVTIEGAPLEESGKMHINIEKSAHLIRMLTKAYADPIGSIIRECAANAKDSHTMANKPDVPIIVRIVTEANGNKVFEVEDIGVGLDGEEFYKYIMGIGETTKSLISNVIGGYGIGCKSPSSYSDGYYYTCRKNGIELKYMIFAGEQQHESVLLYSMPTEKPNGVIVSVPIKKGDEYEFKEKIAQQLAYFSGVYFENCDVSNDFKIYRNEDYQFSELCCDGKLHFTLDDVYYPIDYNKLGIDVIYSNIALRFSLTDGIAVIPNRENIEYTKETKKLLINKIEKVATLLVEKFNKNVEDFTSTDEVFAYFNKGNKHTVNITDSYSIAIGDFIPYTSIPLKQPELASYPNISLRHLHKISINVYNAYTHVEYFKNGKWLKDFYKNNLPYKPSRNYHYVLEGEFEKKRKIYFKNEYFNNYKYFNNYGSFYFYRKLGEWKLFHKNSDLNLYKVLNLATIPRQNWRGVIKDWFQFIKEQEAVLQKEKDVVIPNSYWERLKSDKVKKASSKMEGEINLKIAREPAKYVGNDVKCVFETTFTKLENNKKTLIIYGEESKKDKLSTIWGLLKNNSNIKVAMVGKQDFKRLQKIDYYNLMEVDDITKEYSKILGRIISVKRVHSFIDKYSFVFKYKDYLKTICSNYLKMMNQLEEYDKVHYTRMGYDDKFYEAIEHFAEKNNWKDFEIESIMNKVKKDINKIDFLPLFASVGYYSSGLKEGSIPVIKELLKYRKFKMDYLNYPVLKTESLASVVTEVEEDGDEDDGEDIPNQNEEIFTKELAENELSQYAWINKEENEATILSKDLDNLIIEEYPYERI